MWRRRRKALDLCRRSSAYPPMAETFDADVIIAGAGMAGATLALALKSAGLEPLLIDPVVFDDQVAPTCRPGREPYLLQVKRQLLNDLAGFHGVEYLGQHRRSGRSVRYLNAGDTYATTLIFTGRRMTVGCWGDLVETKAVKTPPERVW